MISFAAPCLKPPFIPSPKRLKGAKGLGVAFERRLAKEIPRATHGQWFNYLKDDEPHWCQTDILLEGAKTVCVIEVKLTNFQEARLQLQDLYCPVLRAAYPAKEVFSLVALRHVGNVPSEVPIFDQLSCAIEAARSQHKLVVFHWLGKGPVG